MEQARRRGAATGGPLAAAERSGKASSTIRRSIFCTSGLECDGLVSPLRGTRRNDNLYAASILAVHAADGELAWYFQPCLATMGLRRHTAVATADLTIAGRCGRYHAGVEERILLVLDRATGEFISGAPFVSGITWASDSIRRRVGL